MKRINLKKAVICLISALTVTAAVGSLSACKIETAHPEAVITYSFNGTEYAVKYTLYRSVRPHTVRHFIELANEGFYNDIIVHDYDSNDWFTGAYVYNAEDYSAKSENAGQMGEYFEQYSKEDAYAKLYADGVMTPTVFKDSAYNDETEKIDKTQYVPALFGEFTNNIQQEITYDPLSAELGCLKIYYYEKETNRKVCVLPTDDQPMRNIDYKTNCATSVFAVQTGASSSYSKSNYAVFAKVSDEDAFDKLLDAVGDFIDDNHGGTKSDFYTAVENVRVDNADNYTDKPETDKGKEVDFKAPKTPIIIKEVKIVKY